MRQASLDNIILGENSFYMPTLFNDKKNVLQASEVVQYQSLAFKRNWIGKK